MSQMHIFLEDNCSNLTSISKNMEFLGCRFGAVRRKR
jgi:hypothetical protein